GANGDQEVPVPIKPIDVEWAFWQDKPQQPSRQESERRPELGRPQEVLHEREHAPAVDTP
ncbi:MAG: hypothetical protein ABWY65_00495, partial [Thermoleophilaceae bacterium]